MPKVLVTSDHSMGSTKVGVNGTIVSIPHNKEVEISEAHLEALQNAEQPRVTVKVLDDSVDTSAEATVVTQGVVNAEGYEGLQGPATPADTSDGTRAGQDVENPAKEPVDPDPVKEPEELKQGPATPAAVSKDTSEQSSEDSSMTAEQADAFVARSIPVMTKEFEGLSAADIDAVLAAEARRDAPDRAGLTKPLAERKEKLAEKPAE
jgi:hypothetical protein